jgi:hypothetical protein
VILNVIGAEAIQNSSNANPLDILMLWKSVEDRLPGLVHGTCKDVLTGADWPAGIPGNFPVGPCDVNTFGPLGPGRRFGFAPEVYS